MVNNLSRSIYFGNIQKFPIEKSIIHLYRCTSGPERHKTLNGDVCLAAAVDAYCWAPIWCGAKNLLGLISIQARLCEQEKLSKKTIPQHLRY